jgi:hypothetical protein
MEVSATLPKERVSSSYDFLGGSVRGRRGLPPRHHNGMQLILGIVCMVAAANIQYAWTC